MQMFGRKIARRYGVRNYPSLTFFRGGDPEAFDGNVLRSDDVVAFLTNPDALQLPDRIEVVRADALFKIIRKEEQVAVLFYDDKVSVYPGLVVDVDSQARVLWRSFTESEEFGGAATVGAHRRRGRPLRYFLRAHERQRGQGLSQYV